MLRAVLDTNVLVSALVSPRGAPASVVRAWMDGEFELVVSPPLLDELRRVLDYPKLRDRITADQATRFLDLLRAAAVHLDPDAPAPVTSPDPDDDFLIALAAAASAYLVSGDADLTGLAPRIPVHDPAAFLGLLANQP